jgi:hypothetical protein
MHKLGGSMPNQLNEINQGKRREDKRLIPNEIMLYTEKVIKNFRTNTKTELV